MVLRYRSAATISSYRCLSQAIGVSPEKRLGVLPEVANDPGARDSRMPYSQSALMSLLIPSAAAWPALTRSVTIAGTPPQDGAAAGGHVSGPLIVERDAREGLGWVPEGLDHEYVSRRKLRGAARLAPPFLSR